MLNYKFSRREKVLAAVFAVVLVGLLWYQFVFVSTSNRVDALAGEVQSVRTETDIALAKLAQQRQMESEIDAYKASGAHKAVVPAYDNTQPLMASLNAVLDSTDDYSLKFDEVDMQGDMVARGVTISFQCGSVKKARSVMRELEEDTFACSIDSVNIAAPETQSGSGSTVAVRGSSSSTAVSLHAVFYEKR